MYLLDTNIFLELLLSQDRADEVRKLLYHILDRKIDVFISRFSLYSIELLMAKLKRFEELRKFIISLSKFQNIKILSMTPLDDLLIVKVVETTKLDFDDAIQYYLVKKYGLKGIISFDKDFDNLDIKRFEPNDVIE